jgi:hypothetical protein
VLVVAAFRQHGGEIPLRCHAERSRAFRSRKVTASRSTTTLRYCQCRDSSQNTLGKTVLVVVAPFGRRVSSPKLSCRAKAAPFVYERQGRVEAPLLSRYCRGRGPSQVRSGRQRWWWHLRIAEMTVQINYKYTIVCTHCGC